MHVYSDLEQPENESTMRDFSFLGEISVRCHLKTKAYYLLTPSCITKEDGRIFLYTIEVDEGDVKLQKKDKTITKA